MSKPITVLARKPVETELVEREYTYEELLDDHLLVKCPACSKRKLRRLLGIPSLVTSCGGLICR